MMYDLNEFSGRLHYLIKEVLKVTPNAFGVESGLGATNVHRMIKPGKDGKVVKPGQEALAKMLEAYPKINVEWLIIGRGEPTKKDGGSIAIEQHPYVVGLRKELDEVKTTLNQIFTRFNLIPKFDTATCNQRIVSEILLASGNSLGNGVLRHARN